MVTAVAPVVIDCKGLWVGWTGLDDFDETLDVIPESDPTDKAPTAGLLSNQARYNPRNYSILSTKSSTLRFISFNHYRQYQLQSTQSYLILITMGAVMKHIGHYSIQCPIRLFLTRNTGRCIF